MSADDTGARVKKDKAVSCLECRRLKLKCDRIFPCLSCRKRGVANLCPNAALPTRPRMQLAEVMRSNATLTQMATRIRDLEGALATLQARHSNQPHPLLLDKGRGSHTQRSVERKYSLSGTTEEDPDSVHESLGTLTIDIESGKSSFFGQSAGMESLYHNDLNEEEPASPGWTLESFDPLKDYVLDPLYPRVNGQAILSHLERYLPEPVRAWELCDLYYDNAAWLWTAIPRSQFETELLLPVYGPTGLPSFSSPTFTHLSAAILFMVFAIASLVDPERPAEAGEYSFNYRPERTTSFPSRSEEGLPSMVTSESERYYQLARAALTAGTSIIEEPSIPGIRVTFLMTYWHMLLDRKQTLQLTWSHMSITIGLASSIGLHRESGPWNLNQDTVEQRRTLFWELYALMSMMGERLAFGRPPQIPLSFVDCELGADPDQKVGSDGEIEHGFAYRMRLMASSILSEVRDLVLNTTSPKYKEVLALDHKVRDCAPKVFGGHVGARNVGPDVLKEPTTRETMQRFQHLFYKEVLILYLHRKYFVRACALRSEVLPNSLYCPSLLAAFRSAEVIILLMDSLTVLQPELSRRFGFLWSHTLASAIMAASIAIRHPRSVLAADAMRALNTVLRVLQRSANKSERVDRPTKALKIVLQLHEKARLAMSQPRNHNPEAPRATDELGVLAGHTRVFVSKHIASPLTSRSTSGSPSEPSLISGEVHASLKEDLNMMSQDLMSHRTPFSSKGAEHDHSQAASVTPYSSTQLAPTYSPSQSLPDMYTEQLGGDFDGSGGAQQYYYAPGFGFPDPAAGAGLNEFGPILSMQSTTRSWGGTEDEITWQGFVAGLGV